MIMKDFKAEGERIITVEQWEKGDVKISPDIEFVSVYRFVPFLGYRLTSYHSKCGKYKLSHKFSDILEKK